MAKKRKRPVKQLTSSEIAKAIANAPPTTDAEIEERAEELATKWGADVYVYNYGEGNVLYSEGRNMDNPYLKFTYIMGPPPVVVRAAGRTRVK